MGKSTVPVGTAMALEERLRRLSPAGDGVEVAWNPEFLREAYAVEDTLRPDRLVFGTHSGTPWTCWRRSTRSRSPTVRPWCDATSPPAS